MASKSTDKDLGWSDFIKELKELRKHPAGSVDVGFFAPEIAQRAAFNEFGTRRIPSRPFIRSTVDANQKKYNKGMTRAGARTAGGMAPAKALIPVANQLRNDLINAIITWDDPPNAESTIAQKGANNPLVDTGEMQRNIQIRTGGK